MLIPYIMINQFRTRKIRYSVTAGVTLVLALVAAIAIACGPGSVRSPIVLSFDDLRAPTTVRQPMSIGKNGKILIYNEYLFVNEPQRGFHVFDNTNPDSPLALAFIPVIGNLDIAIKDDNLYADSHIDLLIFDISDIENITLSSRFQGAFNPKWENIHYNLPDDAGIIVGFN